jgi:hypothetical protein
VHEVPLRSITGLTSSIHIYVKKTLSYKNFELLLMFTGYHSLINHWLVTGTYESINLYIGEQRKLHHKACILCLLHLNHQHVIYLYLLLCGCTILLLKRIFLLCYGLIYPIFRHLREDLVTTPGFLTSRSQTDAMLRAYEQRHFLLCRVQNDIIPHANFRDSFAPTSSEADVTGLI